MIENQLRMTASSCLKLALGDIGFTIDPKYIKVLENSDVIGIEFVDLEGLYAEFLAVHVPDAKDRKPLPFPV